MDYRILILLVFTANAIASDFEQELQEIKRLTEKLADADLSSITGNDNDVLRSNQIDNKLVEVDDDETVRQRSMKMQELIDKLGEISDDAELATDDEDGSGSDVGSDVGDGSGETSLQNDLQRMTDELIQLQKRSAMALDSLNFKDALSAGVKQKRSVETETKKNSKDVTHNGQKEPKSSKSETVILKSEKENGAQLNDKSREASVSVRIVDKQPENTDGSKTRNPVPVQHVILNLPFGAHKSFIESNTNIIIVLAILGTLILLTLCVSLFYCFFSLNFKRRLYPQPVKA